MHKMRIALCSAILSFSATVPAVPQAVAHETATSERFQVETIGAGSDVILIPGLNTTREVWRPTAEALSVNHRVHLIQISGFGSAAGPNSEGKILDAVIVELANYIEREQMDAPVIVGHSLGGFTALSLALRHPDTAGRIVIVDSLPFFSILFNPAATAENMEPQAAQFRAAALAMGRQAAPADCDNVSPLFSRMSKSAEGRCQIARWAAEADPAVSAQLTYELMTHDLRGELSRLKVPTTVLYARQSAMGPSQNVDALWASNYAAAPDVTLVPIDDSLHFTMLDNFEATLAAINQATDAAD